MRSAYRTLVDALPADGDLEVLVSELAARRGRPIEVHATRMPVDGPSGLVLSTARADHVVLDAGSPPSQRVVVLLHELAHLVLGHAERGDAPRALAALLAPDVSPEVAVRYLARGDECCDAERSAETVALRVASVVRRRSDDAAQEPFWRRLR